MGGGGVEHLDRTEDVEALRIVDGYYQDMPRWHKEIFTDPGLRPPAWTQAGL